MDNIKSRSNLTLEPIPPFSLKRNTSDDNRKLISRQLLQSKQGRYETNDTHALLRSNDKFNRILNKITIILGVSLVCINSKYSCLSLQQCVKKHRDM